MFNLLFTTALREVGLDFFITQKGEVHVLAETDEEQRLLDEVIKAVKQEITMEVRIEKQD